MKALKFLGGLVVVIALILVLARCSDEEPQPEDAPTEHVIETPVAEEPEKPNENPEQ